MKSVGTAMILVLVMGGGIACGDLPSKREKDEKAIRANVEAYVAAYQKKDAKVLASFWAEDGQFVSPVSGKTMSGREKIAAEYTAMLAESGEVALKVNLESLRFLTANVAVEEGTATVIYPGELPSESSYQVIHKKVEDKWLIDSVRETVLPDDPEEGGEAAKAPAEMKALEWMVGDWIDEGDGSTIYLTCSWGMGRKFLKREFEVAIEDRITMNGIEVIGWDPAAKTWRSWVFDSEGGFGAAVWSRDGDTFTKQMTGTTKTGQKAFAAHTVIKVDDNTYQWSAHGRELDGELLPNIDSVTVVRQTGGN